MKNNINNTEEKKRTHSPAGRIFLICLLTVTTVLILCATPLFSVTDIEVNGNSYYSKNLIINKSGLFIGQNGFSTLLGRNPVKMMSLRCSGAELEVTAACPYVKTIQARYIPPHTVRIDIEERSKSVIIPFYESGLLIDGEGVVVDIVKDYGLSGLPVALGLGVTRYSVGKKLEADDDLGVETVLAVINALKQADRDGGDEALAWIVTSIDVSDPRSIILGLNNGIKVNLGDGTDLYYRVNATKEIITHGIDGGEKGVISFINGARPVFAPA